VLETSQTGILPKLLLCVKDFFKRSHIAVLDCDADDLEQNLHFTQGTSFQKQHYNPRFISQALEVSRFCLKFYEAQRTLLDVETLVDIEDTLERLLLMNLNLNFLNYKSDFSEPLDLIKKFLKASEGNKRVMK
jgi:hypothetical protein